MSEPTLDDLRVPGYNEYGHFDRRLTPAEFDRIARERGYFRPLDTSRGAFRAAAPNGEVWEVPERVLREQGYVKRPVCGECEGSGVEPCVCVADCPHGDCPSCGGTGFGRVYIGRCSECGGDLIRCVRVWGEGKKCCPDCVHPQVLAALDGGQDA